MKNLKLQKIGFRTFIIVLVTIIFLLVLLNYFLNNSIRNNTNSNSNTIIQVFSSNFSSEVSQALTKQTDSVKVQYNSSSSKLTIEVPFAQDDPQAQEVLQQYATSLGISYDQLIAISNVIYFTSPRSDSTTIQNSSISSLSPEESAY